MYRLVKRHVVSSPEVYKRGVFGVSKIIEGKQMTQPIGDILGPRTKDNKTILDPRIPRKTQQQTENIANYLVQKFNSPQFRPIFLKSAWRLSEKRINAIVEEAFKKASNPRAYFIASVKRERAYKA